MKVLSTVGAMIAFASCASAFVAPFSVSRPASSLRMSATAGEETSEMSTALPWLKQPKNLDGMAGNFGFDPLGLATKFPAKCLQEGELKNGRVAMLAFVGFLVSEVVHLPGPAFQSDNPLDAMAAVGPVPMTMIFFFCGALEWSFHNVSACMLCHDAAVVWLWPISNVTVKMHLPGRCKNRKIQQGKYSK